jgi:hypothetical protein
MSAAEDAYKAAEAAIEEAKRTGAETLVFEDEAFRALETLPPGINALEGLRTLGLNNTQISDLDPLQGLKGLQDLWLAYTQVSDLDALRGLTGLRGLQFDSTQVSDLAPLQGLTGLQTLWLDSTQVSDLAPLQGLTELRSLSLRFTPVSDLAPLEGLARLYDLWLDNTQVSDLAPLRRLTGLEYLSLDNTQVGDLAPLRGLTGLQSLWLGNTQVSDLDPLRGLTELQTLSLDSTQALDLRPLAGLRKLGDGPPLGGGLPCGLTFTGVRATADPKIAKIAELKDESSRAEALFALLDAGWVPPVMVEPVPLEPDPLLRSILIDGKLEIEVDPPTEDERRDRVKAVLHDRLKEKATDLSVLAGNRFPRLAKIARALMVLLDRPFDELNVLIVHLEIEDLEDRRATGAEDEEPYTDEVRLAIADVTRAGPGLTVGHPGVDEMLKRRREAREAVIVAEDDAKHQRLSQAVIDDAEANGPNSRAMEETLTRIADEAATRALVKAKHQNLIWKITTLAAFATGGVASDVAANLIAGAYGEYITAFVTTNWQVLSDVAATYGQGVLLWFQQTVGPLMAGIDTTAIRPVNRPKRGW